MTITAACTDPARTPSHASRFAAGAAVDETTQAWLQALCLRGNDIYHHTLRSTELTLLLSQKMHTPGMDPHSLRRGALLHDIGKLAVPDAILLKPGPLSDSEWQVMRQHPSLGHAVLKGLPYPSEVLEIPYCHHERWDGNGYPRGLRQHQIPLAARIFAVIDVWDALMSDRPYRPAWSQQAAWQYLYQQAGRQFDPVVVKHFMELYQTEPDAFEFYTVSHEYQAG